MHMDFKFSTDLKAIREIEGLSQMEFARQIGVEQVTISRNEMEKTEPSARLLEYVYSYAFNQNIRLNKLKEMLWKENLGLEKKLLFHGAKSKIEGMIDLQRGRANNDFGRGFYTGESYEQAVAFVSGFDKSSVYYLSLDERNLRCKKYSVDQEWMMTIAYYRGTLDEYKDHPIIKDIAERSRDCDYIIAPIADNRMFRIIHSFIEGELTDEQCKHCLAATNLGMQYVLISEKALSQAELLERVYLSENERQYFKRVRSGETKLGDDKVKLAKRQYRGQGRYIDEILTV